MEKISGLSHFPVYRVFEDFCTVCSCSLHNAFMKVPEMARSCYKELYDKRENEYLEVVKRYDKNVFGTYFPQILADLTKLLFESPKDYLRTIFMELNLGKHFNGQFFTPSHICEFMAEITFDENVEKSIAEKGYCRVAEPACGSGAMVLGIVQCLKNRGYEQLGGKLYIEATDIDPLCVSMAFIQLSLLGLSARVFHGNSLTQKIFETWDSPNLQMANMTGYFS